jgi:ubiquinone/menaquinone biosynthesis C-methylase UbiE
MLKSKMNHSNFTNVTEQPGQSATNDQLSIMMTRYNLARVYSEGKDVLEIASGSGTGLGYIASVAKTVVGGDIDEKLVQITQNTYQKNEKVRVLQLDAQAMPFEDNSFDTLIFFEAIYYIPNVAKMVAEMQRVVRPNGTVIIASVNCQWHGFNPSPFSLKYYSAEELLGLFSTKNQSELQIGFLDLPKGSNFVTSFIRRVAVSLGLIPKTMEGKERLKRLFYGKLKQIPSVIYDDLGKIEPLIPYTTIPKNEIENYKQLYLITKILK